VATDHALHVQALLQRLVGEQRQSSPQRQDGPQPQVLVRSA
jgi:hypothetical protein